MGCKLSIRMIYIHSTGRHKAGNKHQCSVLAIVVCGCGISVSVLDIEFQCSLKLGVECYAKGRR